jgi:hypothetical protein
LALAWIAKGYFGWFNLITIPSSDLHFMGDHGWNGFFLMVVIPILDIVAGVSLWISWRWGSGVWACVALGYVCLEFIDPSHLLSLMPLISIVLLLVIHFARVLLVRINGETQIKIL